MELNNIGFIGVHLGAGNHSTSKLPEYRKVCKMACRKAMEAIKLQKTALEAITIAIQILEDCPLTNAGIGSNLTEDGTVECDASIMDGLSCNFGAVAAVKGIQNPILVAKKLVEEQSIPRQDGRVPPMMLCGEGAHNWAVDRGMKAVPENTLISENALTSFKKYSRKNIAKRTRSKTTKRDDLVDCDFQRKKVKKEVSENENEVSLDTVGAVCLDNHGNLCSGVSSGGLLLKYPGRIGQAAVYGAGCWSSNRTDVNSCGVACSSSGCGEQLIRTLLCKECADMSSDRDGLTTLQELLQDKFLGSSKLSRNEEKLAGVILLQCRQNPSSDSVPADKLDVEFTWGHTTRTMAVGFMNIDDNKPEFHLTTLASNCSVGRSVLVQGVIKQHT